MKEVYLPLPVDRAAKAEWNKKGYKVLPLDMMPAGFDNPADEKQKPARKTKEAE